jgi:hypothetical protein
MWYNKAVTNKGIFLGKEAALVHGTRGQYVAPRHLVWSTDSIDLADPFQRTWYIRQVLLHGRSEDVRTLDLHEVAEALDDLRLPADLHRLWQAFLEKRGYAPG